MTLPVEAGGLGIVPVYAVNAKMFGASGNGSTDDSVAIQSAINAVSVNGGGAVVLPPGVYRASGIILANGVTLWGGLTLQPGYDAGGLDYGAVTIKGNAGSGTVIEFGSAMSAAIVGINVDGNFTQQPIHLTTSQRCAIKNVCAVNAPGPGIQSNNGTGACVFEDILVMNCNQTAPNAVQGTVDIDGTDHYLHRIESAGGLGALQNAGLFNTGIVLRGTNCFMTNCIGETSDVGFQVLTGTKNRVVGCRADLNWGDGWRIPGGGNSFAACHSSNNGKATTNTYNGFKIDGFGNNFNACTIVKTDGQLMLNGFLDSVSVAAVSSRNVYAACVAGSCTTMYNFNTFLGSAASIPCIAQRPSSGTTLDVTNTTQLQPQHSSATNVTNFTGGISGQVIQVLGNANITIVNGSGIDTNTGANKVLVALKIYTFTLVGTIWVENA